MNDPLLLSGWSRPDTATARSSRVSGSDRRDGSSPSGGAANVGELAPVQDAVDHAGSLYAVEPVLRRAAACQLAEAGWWVHVDVIVPARGPLRGVSLEDLAAVRSALPQARVEVHLVDLAATDRIGAVLEEVLLSTPDRVVLPDRWCTTDGHRVRGAGAQLWVELDRSPLLTDVAVDGVLVMLIEPGTTQTIDLTRLAAIASLPAGTAIGVDGGVGPEHEAQCVAAGVRHLVSGRALLNPGPAVHAQAGRGAEESRT